jgi:hypothetical protein
VSAVERDDAARGEGLASDVRRPDVQSVLPIVRRVVHARVSDRELAEDLVQEPWWARLR